MYTIALADEREDNLRIVILRALVVGRLAWGTTPAKLVGGKRPDRHRTGPRAEPNAIPQFESISKGICFLTYVQAPGLQ